MSSSKRASTIPAGPKPPTVHSPNCVIAGNATLTGTYPIAIGSKTVINPHAKLNSLYGPITVGDNCIIWERCAIGMQSMPVDERGVIREGVVIEDGVVLEMGVVCEGKKIGAGSLLESGVRVGKGAVIGKHCKISAQSTIAEDELIPDYTVIYGHGLRRTDKSGVEDLKMKLVAMQVELMRKMIPSNLSKFQ